MAGFDYEVCEDRVEGAEGAGEGGAGGVAEGSEEGGYWWGRGELVWLLL